MFAQEAVAATFSQTEATRQSYERI